MNFIPRIEYTELGTLLEKTITFDSPPEGDPFNETYTAKVTATRSTGGARQVQHNYNLKTYRIEFIFQTEAVKLACEDFVLNHLNKGGNFKYYPHSDEVEYEIFEGKIGAFSIKRPIPGPVVGTFEYDFKFTFERVV